MNFKQTLTNTLLNLPGWHTRRKIVVIESDDWGSIRMPSREVYEKLLRMGIAVDKCPYNRNDSLASEEDLQELFNVLVRYKDVNGNTPIITANTVVANPDFSRIKESGYENYYYEPFVETLKKYPKHEKSFFLWKKGISEKLFYPQFHGREHVNINLWLKLLKTNESFRKAFDLNLWGLGPRVLNIGSRMNIQASFDAENVNEIENHHAIIQDGLNLFEDIFGYRSKSFIANNFIWDSELDMTLKNNGVDIIQGMKYQLLPRLNEAKRKKIYHYTGELGIQKQLYLVRNCIFEPTENHKIDSVESCLKDIKNAFFWQKPAVITAHRVNFIGTIDVENRNKNLKSLDILLKRIIERWPDVEFLSSEELGYIIKNDKK